MKVLSRLECLMKEVKVYHISTSGEEQVSRSTVVHSRCLV